MADIYGGHMSDIHSENRSFMSSAAAKLTSEEYEAKSWPVIQNALKLLLNQPEGKYTSLSYEEVYGSIYNCVCKQFSERLFQDLCNEMKDYLASFSMKLQETKDEDLIDAFDVILQHFKKTLDGIIPLFSCMNRFYLVNKLKTDLRRELFQIFLEVVVNDNLCRIIKTLEYALLVPFSVHPSKMANVVKGLYNLSKDYVQLSPNVFAAYIPNVLPPMKLSDLPSFVAETQQFQQDLHRVGFLSNDQSRKRANEDSLSEGRLLVIRKQEENV